MKVPENGCRDWEAITSAVGTIALCLVIALPALGQAVKPPSQWGLSRAWPLGRLFLVGLIENAQVLEELIHFVVDQRLSEPNAPLHPRGSGQCLLGLVKVAELAVDPLGRQGGELLDDL
eukprot:3045788-Pyramimonas_sp.AAC.1